MKKNTLFCSLLFALFSLSVSSQSLNEAKELYKIGEFDKALPVFFAEYTAKPTDATINQWYGVCLYETGGDLQKAEECIAYAAKKNIPDAFLYLGKIYTETYRFDAASAEFKKYERLKKRDKDAMAQLRKAEKLLDTLKKSVLRTEDIQIIDSVVIDKNVFLSAYKLSPNEGHIDYYNAFFKSGTNKTTIYSNEKRTKVYYAKPSESNKNELFSMEKLYNDFGNEKKLSENNFGLSGNLNYPYVLTDGVTIYFSAEDTTGLGGYDIYITRYNMNSDTYLTPERLNMPFNSFFNDYMMVVDEEKGVGWFASDRFQPEGKVCIYTFIPNEQVTMLKEEDEYLIRRAMISSIKDSWKENQDYSPIIALARKSIEKKEKRIKDFEFVVHDSYTYYNWSDFKNSLAKDLYHQAREASSNLDSVNSQLDALRNSYHSQSSQATANKILELEYKQNQLFHTIKSLEMEARNKEIIFLNNRGI